MNMLNLLHGAKAKGMDAELPKCIIIAIKV